MPLYRTTDGTVLCDRCVYDEDNTCNFPQRPHAQSCTMFRDRTLSLREIEVKVNRRGGLGGIQNWIQRYRGAIALTIIIAVALLLALS